MIPYNTVLMVVLSVVVCFMIRWMLFKTGMIYTTKKLLRRVQDWFHVYQFIKVPEFNESMQRNQLYRKVSLYLHSLPSIEDSDFTNLITGNNQNDIVLRLDPGQTIEDRFLGATLFWFNQKTELDRTAAFVLRIRKTDKRRILRPYLHHIHAVADEIEHQGKRHLRLFINGPGSAGARWRSVPFNHPATFETIAMEKDLKNKIKSDLESFLKAKKYYQRLGRAWKRSFLLYGPSGTGKSSFVAAMANFLRYDVYDVDLSKVRGDSDLKHLLLETTPKSIVVVEDLDRFLTEDSESAVTASGIQNFMDGIVSSCCGEERVMVFTMNSKLCVDPNLLRPGRVDVHIHFPTCDFSAFKTLASSYLGVKEHKLFAQVEDIFRHGASLSPAEIGELMIANRNSPSRAIKSVIGALQTDGDGRRCGVMIGRQLEDGDVDEVTEGVLCGGDGFSTVKDLRKFYGFFKLRNAKRTQLSNSLGHDR
ncbi:AAA-ATPase At2g46620-like [Abrus precatorius]|uniref:AAA-ATPase At2g46620-like n=1 Tax=Abrus precatorius TaxID=3816 RepID=A0A8B8K1I6_ABRPR|nr:AAA-ATPase At2g46620-like [Abrus precatorius]